MDSEQMVTRLMAVFEPQVVAMFGLEISGDEAIAVVSALEQLGAQLRQEFAIAQSDAVMRLVLPST